MPLFCEAVVNAREVFVKQVHADTNRTVLVTGFLVQRSRFDRKDQVKPIDGQVLRMYRVFWALGGCDRCNDYR